MTYLTVKTLSPQDAGYLAGLIDGEGTITLTRRNQNKQRGLVVTISNTEMSILTHVQKMTGVGKITNKRIAKANHTPSFTYQVANRQALDILKQIAAQLRSYKADRARLALQDYTRLTPRNGRYSLIQLQERTQFVEKFLGIRTGTLGLLTQVDEPETHFNPDWRANFVTRLHQSFNGSDGHEMLVTTHTPFLISDSRPEKVLVFNKEDGVVSVGRPDYNTLGASINKITMATFGKRETIGLRAQTMLDDFRSRSNDDNENKEQLIAEINRQLGDSVEKVLLIKTILDSMEAQG